jgi:probable rRNA maturation factor
VPSFEFSFQQTALARRASPISAKLRNEIKRASKLVAFREIECLAKLNLSVIAMSDAELLSINIASLGHDFLTDVITFEIERSTDEESRTSLEAEIYISVERANENALKFKQTFESEIARLVIHGILHIAGYTDKTPNAKKRMRNRERYYLAEIFT